MPPDHRRQNRGLLAAAERRLLIWIARRLPAAITSDHLSLLSLGSMALAATVLALAPLRAWAHALVVAALAANWFGDSLDGTVARVRDQQRLRCGFLLRPRHRPRCEAALMPSGLARSAETAVARSARNQSGLTGIRRAG